MQYDNVLEYFKYGGRWNVLKPLPLMTTYCYALVRLVYTFNGKEDSMIRVIHGENIALLNDEFEELKRRAAGSYRIVRIEICDRANNKEKLKENAKME